MNGEVRVVDDVPGAFATLVRDEIERSDEEMFSIAFSGGSTATPAYEQLAKQDVDWSSVIAVWGDERCVPLDHEDSNYMLARRALLDNVSPLGEVYPMQCADHAPGYGADAYEETIRDIAPLDLVHLGMGNDGHTASLFPGAPSLDESERFVVATGDDLHEHRRLTLTFPAINQSRLAVFTVTGETKREMFNRVRDGEDFPAGRINAERVIWLVDPDANGRQ